MTCNQSRSSFDARIDALEREVTQDEVVAAMEDYDYYTPSSLSDERSSTECDATTTDKDTDFVRRITWGGMQDISVSGGKKVSR